eukprot:CAMPEP_0183795544 /NCGR_PEP_ID=MMETSP0803_2-20130417/4601_1 /TAXON_ID=195967 /ORGANISM="Crustomastix stigmata, Strain CCMP3273" /LENGTH=195 /DNA_ID=CAMNT_0026039971 /DNA_START=35 /DNA_END=622 /DNA_ORIENTATION=+
MATLPDGKMKDLAMWVDPVRSGAVLGGATLSWLVLEKSGYTLLTIASNLLLLLLISLVAWKQAATFFTKMPPPPAQSFELSEATVRKVVDITVSHVNLTLAYCYKLGTGNDLVATAQALLALYVVSKVGAFFHILTLCWLGVVGFFSWPKLYAAKQAEIDKLLGEAKAQLEAAKAVLEKEIRSKISSAAPAKKTE